MNKYDYDIVIVGAGAAGTVAAIAAGRKQCKTLLIEKENCAGGMATSGLLSIFGPFDNGQERIIRGIPEEILSRLLALKAAEERATGFIPINSETLKFVLDAMLVQAGVSVWYHTLLVDVAVKNGLIDHITIATKSGLKKIVAQQYIDATGDGTLASLSGVPYEVGDAKTGWVQPMTMVCRLGGVDEKEYRWEGNFRYAEEINLAKRNGELTFDTDGIGAAEFVPGMPGVIAVNMSHIYDLNPISPTDISQAEIIGRQQAQEILLFFRKYVRGCSHAYLIDTAMQVGIRESRRIRGKYMLTKEDIVSGKQFYDGIACNAYHIDIHLPTNQKKKYHDLQKPKNYYMIPYRCLLPDKVDNLLVAGRCISTTHEALGSVRIMPACMAIGQAAGTAAAIAVYKQIIPSQLEISLLQSVLENDGVYLGAIDSKKGNDGM
ncbi:MAG: FAD-dependent oxidoreductase [bacterium]|nr:FAD-dependent oxidoreductase [bacterium]